MTDELAALAAGSPGWHIWRSRSESGRETDWNATRGDRRAPGAAGLAVRLTAPDAASLRSLLEQQEALRRGLVA